MPAPLKIKLTPEEDLTLLELNCANGVPRRTKLRAIALRLNAQGYNVREIADYLDWAEKTVRQSIHRWSSLGLMGLWEASGRGRTRRWADEDWLAVERWLTEERRYSARQISQRLQSEKNIQLGTEQVRRILKKKDWRWKRIRNSPANSSQPQRVQAKLADLETLKLWASMGLICLKYLDESGCSCHSTTDYTYAPRGQQKKRKQSRKRGRRINILGLWEPKA